LKLIEKYAIALATLPEKTGQVDMPRVTAAGGYVEPGLPRFSSGSKQGESKLKIRFQNSL